MSKGTIDLSVAKKSGLVVWWWYDRVEELIFKPHDFGRVIEVSVNFHVYQFVPFLFSFAFLKENVSFLLFI